MGSEAIVRPALTDSGRPFCFGDAPTEAVCSDETTSKIAKALGHPARVAIVGLIGDTRGEALMTRDIVKASGLAQSTVSEHLRILRDAGLVVSRRDGAKIWYCLRRPLLREFSLAIKTLAGGMP